MRMSSLVNQYVMYLVAFPPGMDEVRLRFFRRGITLSEQLYFVYYYAI
jgi:hypothetical protein